MKQFIDCLKGADMAQVRVAKRKRPWQDIAQEAQEYRDASIARAWPDLPQLPEKFAKNVTKIPGTILSQEEVQITEMAPEGLLGVLASGDLTAVAVTTAFLHRASLAQKLVWPEELVMVIPVLILKGRPTVSQKSSLSEPWPAPDILMTILLKTRNPLGPCTVYQSVSKSTLALRAWV